MIFSFHSEQKFFDFTQFWEEIFEESLLEAKFHVDHILLH